MNEGLLPNLVSNPTPISKLLSLESCSVVGHSFRIRFPSGWESVAAVWLQDPSE